MSGRPPRLDRDLYVGERSVAITLCVFHRVRHFVNRDDLVEACIQLIREVSEAHQCIVPIYCFMPDHIHYMLQGRRETSDTLAAAEQIKVRIGVLLHRRKLAKLQPGIYDHLVRGSEDWRNQARYIAFNPVRAGLVENYTDYPYLGSLHGNVRDLFD